MNRLMIFVIIIVTALVIGVAYSLYNKGIVGEFEKYPPSGFRDTGKVTIMIPEGTGNPESGITYQPQTVRVVLNVNNTVIWLNADRVHHRVVGDRGEFSSEPIGPNQTWNHTFTNVGVYGYHDKPWLRGTVIVLEE